MTPEQLEKFYLEYNFTGMTYTGNGISAGQEFLDRVPMKWMIRDPEKGWVEFSDDSAPVVSEEELREQNPALKKAWENYQTILELVK